jgi:hypothetical protein
MVVLRRIREIEWTFSNTAETATALGLACAVLVAIFA